jgi:hypothetical protein
LSDIFTEVDEEVRREQLKKLWDRHGKLIIALAVLIVAAVGGWRGYQWWDARKIAESGAAYDAAVALIDSGKTAEAETALAKIAAEGTPGYRTLARLRAAGALAERDPKAAVAGFDAVAADSSVPQTLRDLAKVRAALILVDSAPLAEMTQRLEPLTQTGGAFRHTARELLTLAAVRAGDQAAAKRWTDAIIADGETPQGLRGRIELLTVLNAGDKG